MGSTHPLGFVYPDTVPRGFADGLEPLMMDNTSNAVSVLRDAMDTLRRVAAVRVRPQSMLGEYVSWVVRMTEVGMAGTAVVRWVVFPQDWSSTNWGPAWGVQGKQGRWQGEGAESLVYDGARACRVYGASVVVGMLIVGYKPHIHE